ncbi:MAG: hypothetical protein PHS49_06335 [Candidatus Gracilibacteria bacterium]|nr:hypothetical protein [Candidatus Gracilibacteria bacterium]
MKNFLENNYKWIVRGLVIIGIFLMLKLWSVGFNTSGCGGGWISICIIPSIEYYWISASYIAVLFLGISIYIIKQIRKTSKKTRKIQLAFIILFLGLIGKQVFFVVSPDFDFYLNDAVYKDSENNLVDIDKYLEQVNKYCLNNDDFKFYTSREGMCGGKYEPDLKTVEEYIKVFESAKNNDNRYLYYLTYRWADENVGLENIIEKYNDDTFYAYVIKNERTNRYLNNILKQKHINIKLLPLLDYIDNELDNYYTVIEKNSIDKGNTWDDFRDKIESFIKVTIKQIPEINHNIF